MTPSSLRNIITTFFITLRDEGVMEGKEDAKRSTKRGRSEGTRMTSRRRVDGAKME